MRALQGEPTYSFRLFVRLGTRAVTLQGRACTNPGLLSGRAKEDEQEKKRLPLHHLLSEPETQAEARILKRETGDEATGTKDERRHACVHYALEDQDNSSGWSVKR